MWVKALIFDMDGTLIANEHLHLAAWRIMFERLGITRDAVEFNHKTTGMMNADIFAQELPQFSVDEAVRLAAEKEQIYRDLVVKELRPAPGVMRLISEAEELGLPIALASSAPIENVDAVLDGLHIRNRFQAVFCPDLGFAGKPAPDLFLAAAEAMGIAPAHCLVFEDAVFGVEAARRAGMKAVALTTSLPAEAFADYENVLHVMPDFTAFSLNMIA